MKSQQPHFTTKGLVALTVLAGIYGLTAVLARFLGTGLGVFEQWYLRYGLTVLLAAAVFYRHVSYRKFLNLPPREWLVLVFRAVVGVTATVLYTLASEKAKIGLVAFMQVLPATALLGVILFHERISWRRATLILISFLGAAAVVVNNIHDLTSFNIGEVYSIISGVLFSLMFVTRKWHREDLNNQELTIAMTGLGCGVNYAISLLLYRRGFITASHWHASFVLVLLAAGCLSVIINFLANYGSEHVSAVIAGNILTLEEVFGPIFGFVFYGELLTRRQLAGGLVILLSVLLMNQLARRERQVAQVAVAPD